MNLARQTEILEKQVDSFTNFGTFIDGDHRYIHEGKKFTVSIEKNMAQDEVYKISIKTPSVASGKYNHWRPAIISSSSSNLLVRIYENITSTNGDAVTPINMERNNSTVSASTVKKGVTATLTGTPIAIFSVGSGGGPQSRGGGSAGADEEIVLIQNTEYIIEVEEPNVAATTAIITMSWYEEDNG